MKLAEAPAALEYRVSCQHADGRREVVAVLARTDEQACDAALRILNSWRAIAAVPTEASR